VSSERGGIVPVKWEVALDAAFRNLVRAGITLTDGKKDHTFRLAISTPTAKRQRWKESTLLSIWVTTFTNTAAMVMPRPTLPPWAAIGPLKYANTGDRGYMVLTATPGECRADWHYVSTVKAEAYTLLPGKSLRTLPGVANRRLMPV
jgi:hypothetical protein